MVDDVESWAGRQSVAADLDRLPRHALRSFADDLGAERAVLLERSDSGAVVLLDATTGGRSAAPVVHDPASLVESDRALYLPLPTLLGGRMAVAVVFASRSMREQHFVGIATRRLMPLLVSCLDLWLRGRSERDRASGMEAAAHLSTSGVVVLDGEGRLVFANRRAEVFMAGNDGLRRAGGSVAASMLRDAVALQHAVAAARSGATSILRLKRPDGGCPLIVTVTSQDDRPDQGEAPLVILHVLDPDHDMRGATGRVCDLHGLSSMERLLAVEIVGGSKLADAATKLGLKVQTARSYLKQIFIKTGTNGQADLIRLLLVSTADIRPAAPMSLHRQVALRA